MSFLQKILKVFFERIEVPYLKNIYYLRFMTNNLIIEVNGDAPGFRKRIVALLKLECKELQEITRITGENCCEHRDLYYCKY